MSLESSVSACTSLTEKEKSYCSQLLLKSKSGGGEEPSQSKISTRPSTRQLSSRPGTAAPSGDEKSWDWLQHFDVLDPSAEQRLQSVKETIVKENGEVSKQIEELKMSILDIQQEIEVMEETDVSEIFLKQLAKKLESTYLGHANNSNKRDTVKPSATATFVTGGGAALVGKKPMKLKAIIKEASSSSTKLKEVVMSEQKKVALPEAHKVKCSKVHQLRSTVAGLRSDGTSSSHNNKGEHK